MSVGALLIIKHLSLSIPNSGESRASDKGEWGGSPKKFFPSLRDSVWSKNKGGRAPWAPPLDPPLPKLEKDIPFGRSLLVKAIIGSTPSPDQQRRVFGKVKDCNSNIFLFWLSISYALVLIMSKANKNKTKLEKII